jgi:alkaline phosphatase D
VIRTVFVDALPESDFTAKALIENLPSGQDVLYQVPVWLTHWAASLE